MLVRVVGRKVSIDFTPYISVTLDRVYTLKGTVAVVVANGFIEVVEYAPYWVGRAIAIEHNERTIGLEGPGRSSGRLRYGADRDKLAVLVEDALVGFYETGV